MKIQLETGESLNGAKFRDLPEGALFGGTIDGHVVSLGLKQCSNQYELIWFDDAAKIVQTRGYFVSPETIIPDLVRYDATITLRKIPLR